MTGEDNWLLDSLEDNEGQEERTIEDLKKVENEKRKRLKSSQSGQRGKRPVKRIEVEIQERMGKRGPLVLMTGQGPKSRTRFNVECSAELRNKLDRLTVGSRGHVAAILISWALDELSKQDRCIFADSIKE